MAHIYAEVTNLQTLSNLLYNTKFGEVLKNAFQSVNKNLLSTSDDDWGKKCPLIVDRISI